VFIAYVELANIVRVDLGAIGRGKTKLRVARAHTGVTALGALCGIDQHAPAHGSGNRFILRPRPRKVYQPNARREGEKCRCRCRFTQKLPTPRL
jgi:hypothetical protein